MYSFYIRPYYLLDTNIISEPTKTVKNQAVIDKLTEYASVSAVSSISLAEMWRGIAKLDVNAKRKPMLENYFNDEIPSLYQEIVFDRNAAIVFGDLEAELQKQGKPKPTMDLLIAATAIANNMILVTHNTKDFEDIPNLMVEDWFEPTTD